MDEFGWMMMVATPFVLGAVAGQLFPKMWQRVLVSGVVASGIYAATLYAMQVDMVSRSTGIPTMRFAEPVRVAIEVALITLPLGMCAGLFLHLLIRSIRTRMV